MTHDCSFSGLSGLSINNQVQIESLQTCFYGFCQIRILHTISEMQKNGKKRIFIGKMDQDAAYHRIHENSTTSSTCISIVDKLALLCMWLTFGTTPIPEEYTTVIEATIDLGKYLLRDESWDTENINSPHRKLLPKEDKQKSANHLTKA